MNAEELCNKFEKQLNNNVQVYFTDDCDMTICKEDRKITINQCRFNKVVII